MPTPAASPTAGRSTAVSRFDAWAGRHPVLSFVLLTYAISWLLWLLASLVGGPVGVVIFVLGALGPMTAAAVLVRRTGGSLGEWARRIVRWRVPLRFYGYAALLPLLIFVTVDVVLIGLGEQVDWPLIAGRVPAYGLTVLMTALFFGGMEEPGWRGYALGKLQLERSPVTATLLLGLAWGVWHVPLYGPAGFVVPLVLAFFYTWLYNRTGSVLLCILLHASFTAAQDHLILTTDSITVDAVILGTYVAAAGLLTAMTRGRLGLARKE
jgi:uncharacterized protein